MPARILSDEPCRVDPFDVLGQSNNNSSLLTHALLCIEAASRVDVTRQSTINCVHMKPPLGTQSDRSQAIGSASLSDIHRRKIKVFVDDRLQECGADTMKQSSAGQSKNADYQIYPAASPPSVDFSRWKFSCVGFVLEAYRAARIRLLDDTLPHSTLDDLKRYYPDFANVLGYQRMRDQLGIGVGNSWPVALAGYVLNSLARDVEDIHSTPYVPKPGDEYFSPDPPIQS